MKIICAGGGTLGSVSPLLAIIEEIKKSLPEPLEVRWLGTPDGPERVLIEADHIPFQALSCGKLRRYWSWDNIVDIGRLILGWWQALWLFGHFRPDVVLTAGSFVAVPVGWAAWLYGVPVMVHQQDVRPGLANRLLAPIARKITVTLKESLRDWPSAKGVWTGNPVRADFLRLLDKNSVRASLGVRADRPLVTVVGGGTGASYLNGLVQDNLDELLSFTQVIHLTGAGKSRPGSRRPDYLVSPFTTDALSVLAAADVVISRAGLGIISELAALYKPALIIPIPLSHQEDNANYLKNAGAARVFTQAGLTSEVLIATLRQLLEDKVARESLGRNLHGLIPTNGAAKIVEEVRKLVSE